MERRPLDIGASSVLYITQKNTLIYRGTMSRTRCMSALNRHTEDRTAGQSDR